MILDGRELEFYKYDGDYKPLLEKVRETLNEVAAGWTREQKDHCLEETEESFKVRRRGSLHPKPQTLTAVPAKARLISQLSQQTTVQYRDLTTFKVASHSSTACEVM